MDRKKLTHQATKSGRTRTAILDATLHCLGRLPYPEVTIAVVSECAGISKGGIQYHFPTRLELLSEAVNHLFNRRLDAYRADLEHTPDNVLITDHIIDHHWKHLTEPEFQIYQQLIVASRANPELRRLLVKRYRAFMRAWLKVSFKAFDWDARDPEVARIGNVAQYLMDGMAYGRIAGQLRDEEIEPMLEFVKNLMRQGLQHANGLDSPEHPPL